MAELPDLTVFAATLDKKFAGKTLQEVDIKVSKKLNVSTAVLKKALEGKKLQKVVREGKTFQLHFSGHVLGIHLMLRGDLRLLEKDDDEPKYLVMGFHFSGGTGFAVVDPLRQATPTMDPIAHKSPDAMEITQHDFSALLAKRKKMVKEVLMDQKALRGIGNTYADEILWEARISPFSVASAIPEKQVKQLYAAMQRVLVQATHDIADASGNGFLGEYREKMRVHGADVQKSPTGVKVEHEKIGGRLSYYTAEQQLFN